MNYSFSRRDKRPSLSPIRLSGFSLTAFPSETKESLSPIGLSGCTEFRAPLEHPIRCSIFLPKRRKLHWSVMRADAAGGRRQKAADGRRRAAVSGQRLRAADLDRRWADLVGTMTADSAIWRGWIVEHGAADGEGAGRANNGCCRRSTQ
ncbi:hypothetical protein ACLOJK_037956 [Asimina triloba]